MFGDVCATGELEYPLINEVPLFWGDMVDYSGAAGAITLDLDPGEAYPGTATGDGNDVLQGIEMVNGSPGMTRCPGMM